MEADTIRCWLENARVRPEREQVLRELIDYLYGRRTLAHVDTWDRIRHGEEIIRKLRKKSAAYRAMSTETRGPFLFALGYFRITDGQLEPIPDALPDPAPEKLTRLLSEFLEPGASIHFEDETCRFGWRIEGEDEIVPL